MSTSSATNPAIAPELQPREFPKRDYHFWMVFLALGVGNALGALEMSAVSNALPTIVHSLGGGATFIWVGAAYGLCQTILVPFGGGLAEIFGRRPVMLGSMAVMSIGSAVCGAAKTMNILILGRVIQGLGAGGIGALTPIIVADMVPLNELGSFGGLINVSWAIFTGIGPVVAGGLAQSGQWRWLFFLNIPICGAAAILILFFLRVPTPPGSIKSKLVKVDWIGNFILVGATTATLLGATWGGSPYPWSSYRVLVPLIIGVVGLIAFCAYEAKMATHPVVPFALMNNRTSISGFLQGFVFPMILTALLYYAPVYLQACKGTSPTLVGAEMLSIVLVVAPSAIAAGISIQVTGGYRPQIWFAWVMLILSTGLLSSVHATTSLAAMLGYLVIGSVGAGIMITCSWFPVIAPLDISQTTLALAFTTYVRNFAGIWGITIGGAILQNGLKARISDSLLASLPGGADVASVGSGALQYSLIPLIPSLSEPARGDLQAAFGSSLQDVWRAFAIIAGLGMLFSLAMKSFVLETAQKPPAQDAEVTIQEEKQEEKWEGEE